MCREIHETQEYIIDDDNLDYPICDCGRKLVNTISDRQLCSYPPQPIFGCECGFKGHVMLAYKNR